jgi:type VI secretion system Hcp family effector
VFVYMKVSNPDITGVGQPSRPDWICLEDCTFGFKRNDTNTAGNPQTGEPEVPADAQAVEITKFSDRSTPALAAWMASPAQARTVTIEYCNNPTELSLVDFVLEGARLRSYKATYDATADLMKETLSIHYKKLVLNYWQQSAANRDSGNDASFEYEAGVPAQGN